MKKYKQLYKYSDCVITNLHIVQHTRWTFSLFISLQCISPNGSLKKDLFYFLISFLFCCFFFLHSTPQPPSGISCGWGKKLQVYSWVWTGCMASGNTGGRCHVSTEYYKATIMNAWKQEQKPTNRLEADWTTSPQRECVRPPPPRTQQLSAADTLVLFQLGECTPCCWCRKQIPNDMHGPQNKRLPNKTAQL